MTLLEAVEARTTLRRQGKGYLGLCPLHGEKTPSFWVFLGDDKQRFHCYGCGAHGDLIDFLQRASGYSYAEAAAAAGKERPVVDERRQRAKASIRQQYLDWRRVQLRQEDGEHAALWDAVALAEVMAMAIARHPGWWTDDEAAYWAQYLGDLYLSRDLAEEDLLEESQRFADGTWEQAWWDRWKAEAGESS